MTKDAVAGRIRRLLAMADKRAGRPRHPGHRVGRHAGDARRPERAQWQSSRDSVRRAAAPTTGGCHAQREDSLEHFATVLLAVLAADAPA